MVYLTLKHYCLFSILLIICNLIHKSGAFGVNTAVLLNSATLPFDGTNLNCALSVVNKTSLLREAHGNLFTNDPEVKMTVPELLRHRGYPYESHRVTTKDGYILTIHRMSHSKKSPAAEGKPPILLAHGFMCDSSVYLILPSNMGLAYVLVDAGYDVWMMNSRGTRFSRRSTKYKYKQPQFWDFSYNEMGEYDVPATINYVLKKTDYSKLFYLGHSQGNMIYWVAASKHPEINDKVRAVFALGPAAELSNLQPGWHLLCGFVGVADAVVTRNVDIGFLPPDDILSAISELLCGGASIRSLACLSILCDLTGFNFNTAYLPKIASVISHLFEGISVKDAKHLCQNVKGTFEEFDYGTVQNMEVYGSSSPPPYDLSKTTARTYVYHGSCDILTTPDASEKLCSDLGGNETSCISVSGFNHLDYVYSDAAKEKIYQRIMHTMEYLLSVDPE